ncbi:MAG: hypothetical protein JOZ72_09875 [Alphaproteobacteria bacterium]|nr:hypothetical protein [Alphaproteobacteria bacterium]
MAKPWLHQITPQTRSGRIATDNGHISRACDFDDRSAAYAPFVRAMLTQIQARAPDARVHFGSPPVAFWMQLAFVSVALILLAAVLLLLPLPAPFPLAVIAKLGVILYGLAMLPRWIRKNLPRDGDLKSAFEQLPG